MAGSTLFRFAAPAAFFPLAGRLLPWFASLAVLLGVLGLFLGLVVAPPDFRQGEVYRILFVHVPAAWMAMFVYLVIAAWSLIFLVWNTRLSAMMAQALVPTGTVFAFVALFTGAVWGKPTWGTWWVWDARLTSTLLLLFLYLGLMALRASIDDARRADRATALLALVGVVNLPVIYFSVRWWNTLHQGASISLTAAPTMATIMLAAMLVMTAAAWCYAVAAALHRVRSIIIEREQHADWLRGPRPSDDAPVAGSSPPPGPGPGPQPNPPSSPPPSHRPGHGH